MLITAPWGGADVAVEVGEECRSVAALQHALAAAVPQLDTEKVCLEIGGRAADDEAVCSLCEGSVVTVSATPAAVRAATILQEEGCALNWHDFGDAAQGGDMRRCELYLDAGVHRTKHGLLDYSPLHIACNTCNVPLLKLLIERGHPLDVQDWTGASALQKAVAVQSIEMCRLLLDAGHPLHFEDDWDTPLRNAIRVRSVELCELLIDSGAMANLTVPQRQSLLDAARDTGHTDLHRLLTHHAAGPVTAPNGSCCVAF